MKFIHTGDLHIGKLVGGFSMAEEQRNALCQILALAETEQADAILLAGDIYDRAIPPKEGVVLFDFFLGRCTELGIPVLGISGNHDSPERISFGEIPLKRQGIYLEGTLKEQPAAVSFSDQWGTVTVHFLPFAGPAQLRSVYGEDGSPASLSDGIAQAISRMDLQDGERHVLLTHHFVGGGGKEPETCDSETRVLVGGADLVDASLFSMFDYTALGHLHGAQKIGAGQVYYSGSPVKYSFSEASQKKSVWVAELREKGNVSVRRHFLKPVHDMRIIRGPLSELIRPEVFSLADREDYICARLTDEEELFQPAETLRGVYPNLMQLVLEKKLAGGDRQQEAGRRLEQKSPEALFAEFFYEVTGREADAERRKIAEEAIDQARKEEP